MEHIFVDGGSTDGTLEYISKERPASTVLTNVSGGISRAMNAGIAAATGDIVAHLHSDDFYKHGGVLSRVAQLFEATGRDWIVGGPTTFATARSNREHPFCLSRGGGSCREVHISRTRRHSCESN